MKIALVTLAAICALLPAGEKYARSVLGLGDPPLSITHPRIEYLYAPGLPEIPETVFEEFLVNALVHRDHLVSASVRLFVFDNRIEIISPGHLPNNLTVGKRRTGNATVRNPMLVSSVAKGLHPCHGLGSGIKRALAEWPRRDFDDDREGCLFTATVHRKPVEELELAGEPGELPAQAVISTGGRDLLLLSSAAGNCRRHGNGRFLAGLKNTANLHDVEVWSIFQP